MRFSLLLFIFLTNPYIGISQYKTLHDFTAKTISGEDFNFSSLKGKKVLIVNTASQCSLTPQYKRLQNIFEEFGDDNFTIVAFPSNDFFNREPGSNSEIYKFCTQKYGVTFLLMQKISVKGDGIHPIYKWLTSSIENGILDAPVKWNFQKFLINKDGQIDDFLPPLKKPDNKQIINWIISE